MAEITRRRQGEMTQALFRILAEAPGGLAAREAIERVEKILEPTPFEDSEYPNRPGVRRFPKIMRFTTIGPVKARWMVKRRGIWSITEEGTIALEQFPDPEALFREANRLYGKWRAEQPDTPDQPDESEPSSVSILDEAEETAWKEIEDFIAVMDPYDFQDLVAGLLKAMKYHVQWIASAGPDRGVDVVASADPLGAASSRLKIQVKRRANPVDVDGLRAFLAVLGDADIGIFVSSGGFTKSAELEARTQERRRITLIDLNRLAGLWVEHYSRLDEEARRLLPLQPVYFLAPEV
ncbi:MAG: restriction endonuclease [Chloroflexi bacterium]|nr:restriction endonuclease [Chloroflexota bacterium]